MFLLFSHIICIIMEHTKTKPQASDEQIAALEIRDLKDTVSALRDALEQAREDKERGVRAALVSANQESMQVKAAAAALRTALEESRADKETAVRQAAMAAVKELDQLKATASALRSASVRVAPSVIKLGNSGTSVRKAPSCSLQ